MGNTDPTSSTPNPQPLNLPPSSSSYFQYPARLYPSSENKQFEDEGAIEKVAVRTPGMTLDQIEEQYKLLVDGLRGINVDHVPHVPDESWKNVVVETPKKVVADDLRGVNGVHVPHVPEEERWNNVVVEIPRRDAFRRKGYPWTEDEHRSVNLGLTCFQGLFLLGLNKHGKGDWKSIAKNFVVTRTPTQVASHAQKYFLRLKYPTFLRRGRSSVLDIHSVNPVKISKKGGKSTKIAGNFKKIAPSPYPPAKSVPLSHYPWDSSRLRNKCVSPVVPMGRNFAPMPSFHGQGYGNSSNNYLNGSNYGLNAFNHVSNNPLSGSNYGFNAFNPVSNNLNYTPNCFNLVPSGLDPMPQGFASTGSNYVTHGHNMVPNYMVSDTLIGVSDTPLNFGPNGYGPQKVSDGGNYGSIDPNYLSNGLSNITLNVPPMVSDASYDPQPVSVPVPIPAPAPAPAPDGLNLDASDTEFSWWDLLDPPNDSVSTDLWDTNMTGEDYGTYFEFP
ncbi:hypothetical protein GIB67_026823 [Kingdonia uniflora]|uniref:Uncharacterized protein n=1 Tax=Kingdonia uniflora TaxID=39325 RepID=A0A7J7MHM4_9MAGN|nr:hypothetical protein GIB67_026823 [Kingdonia uniflora]